MAVGADDAHPTVRPPFRPYPARPAGVRAEDDYLDAMGRHAAVRVGADRVERLARAIHTGSASPAAAALLRVELQVFAQKLFEHFHYEETDGYLAHDRSSHPLLRATLGRLRDEHLAMRRDLQQLVAIASTRYGSPELADRVLSLLEALERHEREEGAILRSAALV